MPPNLNFSGMSLLIVDEDIPSARRMATAMARRGFKPAVASTMDEGAKIAASDRPAFALVELRLPDGNGLDLVKSLCAARPNCRVVVLTSFGSVESAVTAVKLGATDYLVKPSSENVVLAALLPPEAIKPDLCKNVMSVDRVRWEHIQRVLELCDHNKSQAARDLNLHRRTLQRILLRQMPV